MQKSPALIVGSLAFDDLEMPSGTFNDVLGGAATYSSIAASLLTPVRLVGVVGNDFPAPVLEDMKKRGVDTAGGVVFTALQDGWVVAYNDETLEELWRFNVGTPLKGAPMTYAIGPKQYLAVQSSGRHVHPVKYDNLQSSSYLFVFALN